MVGDEHQTWGGNFCSERVRNQASEPLVFQKSCDVEVNAMMSNFVSAYGKVVVQLNGASTFNGFPKLAMALSCSNINRADFVR